MGIGWMMIGGVIWKYLGWHWIGGTIIFVGAMKMWERVIIN